MTNAEMLAFIQTPEFDLNNYQPNETDSPSQAQAKVDFLTQLASLNEDETLDKPEPITCMVNCVIMYLECVGGSGGGGQGGVICWTILQDCIGNCQQ